MGQQPIYSPNQVPQQQFPPQVPQPTGQIPEAPQTAWRPSRVTLPPPLQEEEVVVATAWHPKSHDNSVENDGSQEHDGAQEHEEPE
jgi:hypothetical protein